MAKLVYYCTVHLAILFWLSARLIISVCVKQFRERRIVRGFRCGGPGIADRGQMREVLFEGIHAQFFWFELFANAGHKKMGLRGNVHFPHMAHRTLTRACYGRKIHRVAKPVGSVPRIYAKKLNSSTGAAFRPKTAENARQMAIYVDFCG